MTGYNSRDSAASANGPFGPGWLPAFPTLGSEAQFVQIQQTTLDANNNPDTQDVNGASVITTVDGDELSFGQNPAYPQKPVGWEDLTLSYQSSPDTFTVTDLDGNATVFGRVSPGMYKPTEVSQAANASTSTFSYDSAGRVSRLLAPSRPGCQLRHDVRWLSRADVLLRGWTPPVRRRPVPSGTTQAA